VPKPAEEIGATGGRGTGPEPVTEAVGFVASLAFAEHLVDLLNDVAVIEPARAGHAAGGGYLAEAGSPAAFMQESIVKIPCRPSMSGGTIAA
jgi:hypothetical protein